VHEAEDIESVARQGRSAAIGRPFRSGQEVLERLLQGLEVFPLCHTSIPDFKLIALPRKESAGDPLHRSSHILRAGQVEYSHASGRT
jgi:hypothetical protein